MAGMLVRIGMALLALVVTAALVVELRAHDMLENTKDIVVQRHPSAAAVDSHLKDLDRVADLRPGGSAAIAAASLNLRTGRYAAAVRSASRATQRDPKNFSAWVTLGLALGGTGDRAGAGRAYQRAHVLNPLYPIPR
jgi:Flp pilus assembly protein TadD